MKDHILKQTKIIYLFVLFALVVLSIWVVKPFVLTIIGGLIIGYIFYPAYNLLLKKIKNKWATAFIVSFLIVLIFTIPFVIAVELFAKEAYVSYIIIKQKLSSEYNSETCSEPGMRCEIINSIKNILSKPQIKFYVDDIINRGTQFFVDKSRNFITSLPILFVHLIILIFVIFYTLKDGEHFLKNVRKILPIKPLHQRIMFEKTKEMLDSTIYGIIVVSIVQGIAAGVGYFIFGVKSPILLGVFTALAAMLPIIGTALVWLPVSAGIIIEGFLKNQSDIMLKGVGLLLYCALFVSLLDNFLRPKIIGDKARLHPVLVLIGILGGAYAFGAVGILLGPLVITLLFTFLEMINVEQYETGS